METAIRIAEVTPWDQGEVAIHGPSVFGASASKHFLYTIPATGERPVKFTAEGLPAGLRLDPALGRIAGSVQHEGDSVVLLRAENPHGVAEKEFTIAIGRGLTLTPPMGWNSWNAWRRWVDDSKVRAAADNLVQTGLAARGYSYVNIDSCWQGRRGGKHNAIQPNRKFGNMQPLSDFIHAQGLKFGIYSTPWTVPWGCTEKEAQEDWGGGRLIGCSSGEPDTDYWAESTKDGRYIGLNKHEAEDVTQWVEWGVDFLKYDWSRTDPRSVARMGRVLKAAARDIVFSICTNARLEHIDVYKAWSHMWRGIPDTGDNWPSVVKNGFMSDDYFQEDWRPHIGPGGWHDLDMLALGPQFDTATSSCPNKLTQDEQITHMTAWALYPSPLILSCDLSAITDFELRLFGNEEVIAVNQDRLGEPAIRIHEERKQLPASRQHWRNRRIWARSLADGSIAIGLFNLADNPDEFSVDLGLVGLSGSVAVRNLWERHDLGRTRDRLSIPVPAHGTQLVTIKP